MVFDGEIVGKYVTLRSATVDDAEFTLSIRQDKELTRYLPYLDITLEQQIAWIKKQRETKGDYFFVVLNKDQKRIGTNSVYDIKDGKGETGRLAMRDCSALESLENQFLLSSFSFRTLGLKETYAYTRKENKRALNFSEFFGYKVREEISRNHGEKFYKSLLSNEAFSFNEERLCKLLYRSSENFFSIRKTKG